MYGAVTVSAEDCEVLFGIELYRLTFGNFGERNEVMRLDISLSGLAINGAKIKTAGLAGIAMYPLSRFRGLRIALKFSMRHVKAFFCNTGILQTRIGATINGSIRRWTPNG